MTTTSLARRLSLSDALVIGLSSMIGAGVFTAFSPAASSAGSWLLAALVIAGVVAWCNATSSAQLAAQYPSSGGTYIYGREQLGPWPGFVAGWGFVVGKTASCAAMALAFATYAVPDAYQKPCAVAAILCLTAVNAVGITRTAGLAKVLVSIAAVALVFVLAVGFWGDHSGVSSSVSTSDFSLPGVLQASAFMFFAFAGYARIATLGEEVKQPQRTIPRAILGALFITMCLYALIGVAGLRSIGADGLAGTSAPLKEIVASGGPSWGTVVVQVGAAAAALGALLAMIAGVGRTTLAMAREGDLPRGLSYVNERFKVPLAADLLVGCVACLLVLFFDVREAIGFSSFGVLVYYLVANISAWTQTGENRRYPRAVQVLGAVGCVALVVSLPWISIVGGVVMFIVGCMYRLVMVNTRK